MGKLKLFAKAIVAFFLIPYVLLKDFIKDDVRNEQLIRALKNRYERFKADASKFSDPKVLDLLRRIKARKDVCEVYARTMMNFNPNPMEPYYGVPLAVPDSVGYWEAAEQVVRKEMAQRNLVEAGA